VRTVFRWPAHPYTAGLLASIPRLGNLGTELQTIPGTVPSATSMPSGCRFCPRCSQAQPICGAFAPPLITVGDRHTAACFAHTKFQLPRTGAGLTATATASAGHLS
jgi:oligopeptide transport system ATP-binding protein